MLLLLLCITRKSRSTLMTMTTTTYSGHWADDSVEAVESNSDLASSVVCRIDFNFDAWRRSIVADGELEPAHDRGARSRRNGEVAHLQLELVDLDQRDKAAVGKVVGASVVLALRREREREREEKKSV